MILGFLQCCTPASACNEPCQRVISHHVNESCHTMSTSHVTRMNLSKHVWHWISFLRFASLHLCHMMRSHSFIHSRRALHVSNDDIFCRSHVTPALLLTYDMTHDIYIVTVVSRVTCSCVMSHLQESWHTCIATVMSHEAWLMTHEPWLMSHDSWAMTHEPWIMTHDSSWLMTHGSWSMTQDSWLTAVCCMTWPVTRDTSRQDSLIYETSIYNQLQIGWHSILRLLVNTFNLVPGVAGFSWDSSFITWY